MSAVLVAETDDFAQAAGAVQQQAAEPLSRTLATLVAALEGSGPMAGSDPGGQAWAASYDRAAHAALHAHVDAVNGCYRLALLFAQSARNYERADLASSPSQADRHAVLSAVATVPGPTSLTYSPVVPSSAGGSGGGPPGWSLVQHAVGYVWPNGHQDRLRRAAAAWNAAAAAVDDAAVEANLPSVAFAMDRLPERDDVVTVCCGVASHLQDLAGVQRSLADACEQLASHLDHVHSEVESELGDLAVQSGIVEGLGFLLSFPTAGAAELPTQGVEASRIASVARRVAELIRAFVEAVRALAATISGLADRAVEVTARLESLTGLRVVGASVMAARSLPAAARTREALAAARLARSDAALPELILKTTQLESKFKHAKDFGVLTGRGRRGFEEFRVAVKAFVADSNTVHVVGRYRGMKVLIHYYNKASRLVVVQTAERRVHFRLADDHSAIALRRTR